MSLIGFLNFVEKKIIMIVTKDNRCIKIQLFNSSFENDDNNNIDTIVARISKEAFLEKNENIKNLA